MTFVGKAELGGDLVNPHVAELQPVFDKPDPVVGDEILNGFATLFFEITTQVGMGQFECFCDGRGF